MPSFFHKKLKNKFSFPFKYQCRTTFFFKKNPFNVIIKMSRFPFYPYGPYPGYPSNPFFYMPPPLYYPPSQASFYPPVSVSNYYPDIPAPNLKKEYIPEEPRDEREEIKRPEETVEKEKIPAELVPKNLQKMIKRRNAKKASPQNARTDKKDEEYDLNAKEKSKKIFQKEGRNRYSNVYRAFIKLLSNPKHKSTMQERFAKIKQIHSLNLSFEGFLEKIREKVPKFTNYINNKEFFKIYSGNQDYNLCFRIFFSFFIQDDGLTHILTINYRSRMKKDSLTEFIDTLSLLKQQLHQ